MLSWFSRSFAGGPNSLEKGEPFYYGWVVVVALFVVGVIGFGISISFGVFFKSLVEDFGSTRVLTSGIFSVYIVLGAVFAVLSGLALDRYGARVIVMSLGVFTGLGLLLTSQASALWHLFISYSLLLAMGIGPVYTIMMSTVSRWFSRRRVLAIGIVGAGMGIGPMLIAPLAAWLISNYDWHTAYLVMGVLGFAVIVPCALLLKKTPAEADTPGSSGQPDYRGPGEVSILEAAKTRNFWLLFAIWFFLACSVLLMLTHIVPHAIDSGIAPTRAALILSLVGGMTVLGRLGIGKVSDIIGRKQAAIGSVLLTAGAILFLIQPASLWTFYLFAVIFGLANGGIDPPIVAQFGDIFGLRHIGVIMGVINLGWGAGAAFGAALGGYIFDVSGTYLPAFFAVIVAMLVAVGLILLLRMPAAGWERQRVTAKPVAKKT